MHSGLVTRGYGKEAPKVGFKVFLHSPGHLAVAAACTVPKALHIFHGLLLQCLGGVTRKRPDGPGATKSPKTYSRPEKAPQLRKGPATGGFARGFLLPQGVRKGPATPEKGPATLLFY